jgi:hypothetical protein
MKWNTKEKDRCSKLYIFYVESVRNLNISKFRNFALNPNDDEILKAILFLNP